MRRTTNNNGFTKALWATVASLLLFGCSGNPNASQNSGSSSSSSSSGGSFTIGGTVTGLTGSGLVLQDNSGDNLSITTTGAFTFKTAIATGKTYSVSILTQPASPVQTCIVTAGAGTASANVTGVLVACGTNTVSIGVTVTGLAGTGLVLQNNGGDNLTVNKNGSYTFGTAVPTGTAYKVTVSTQPTVPAQICSVASGTGTANANVGNIVATCSTPTISIGGSVTGLSGAGLVLQDNGGNNLAVSSNGAFTFSNLIVSGTSYNVTVITQPTSPAQTCTVSAGTATALANVTTVQVLCPAVFFPVGGQVSGLAGAGSMVLQNNGGDNLPVSGNGPFTFVTPIAYGGQFDIFILLQSLSQLQPCVIWNFQGSVIGPVNSILIDCGHNDWNWMDGSNTANAKGFTATPPVSPVTALDTASPGGRKYPATWVDNSGNLWMFGGIGFDIPTTTNPIFLNDMWQYSGTQRYYGGYDSGASTYWVQNQANNWFSSTAPGPRWGAVSWKDNTGKLLLFGGQAGTLGAGGIGFLNDMWQFDTSGIGAWTRLSFTNPLCNNSAFNNNGIYGTQGTPSANNCPGSRWGAAYSTDASGNLWVFGGFGFDAASSTPGLLNDLWEYTTAGQWVWVSGANTINPDGVYGTQGTAASSNVPGGRQAASSWLDASGTVWLFGGYNLSQGGQPNGFNDLWKYSSGQWTWVSGANTVNQTGIYGVQGTPAAANAPGARWGAASWIDPAGRLWLFGGEGYDTTANGGLADLWQFSAGQWTWVKGPNSVSQVGAYGLTPAQQDFPHVVNYPGSRFFPAYWNDRANGYFWMLGGEGFDSTTTSGGIGLMNDLWRYLPFP